MWKLLICANENRNDGSATHVIGKGDSSRPRADWTWKWSCHRGPDSASLW